MKDSECKLMRVSAVARGVAYRFADTLRPRMAKGEVLTYLVETHPKLKKFWVGCSSIATATIPQAAGKGGEG